LINNKKTSDAPPKRKNQNSNANPPVSRAKGAMLLTAGSECYSKDKVRASGIPTKSQESAKWEIRKPADISFEGHKIPSRNDEKIKVINSEKDYIKKPQAPINKIIRYASKSG
jgi:hypothetical protein